MKNQIRFSLIRSTLCALAVSLMFTLASCSPIAEPIDKELVIDTNQDINTLLDEYTNTQLAGSSDMQLLIDGPVSRQAYRNLINSATETINLEMWAIDEDSDEAENIGQEFVDLLSEKARQGVTVNVILDGGAQKFVSSTTLSDQLKAAGVNVRGFVPPLDKILGDQMLYHSHKKFAVADGKDAILGGMNFGFHYMGENQWRDTNVHITGPVVAKLQRNFIQDWAALGEPVTDESRYFPALTSTVTFSIRIVDQNPTREEFGLNEAIRIALRCAKDHVDIEAPYFNPTPWMQEEITAAVARGVRVRILTNSEESDDMVSNFYITASFFQEMVDAGVEIYLWSLPGRTIHSKSMVVDNNFAFVGSYNFNCRSIIWDSEIAAVFTDAEPVARIQEMISYDLSRDFITPVTQAWIDSQNGEDITQWNFSRKLNIIMKKPDGQ
jgi:cardiolipin synthase